jgi:hypothetical protein
MVKKGATHQVLASFLFGREDPIPDMFTQLVKVVEDKCPNSTKFQLYLNRHITKDAESHRPLTEMTIREVCGANEKLWDDCAEAGNEAIRQRILLWDGVTEMIEKKSHSSSSKLSFA